MHFNNIGLVPITNNHHVQCTDLFRTMEEGRGLKGGGGSEGILGR